MTEKVQKIDRVKAKAGRLIKVWNTLIPKLSNANKRYVSVWVENADGAGERCLLFTENEIAKAEYRAKQNAEDLPAKDRLVDLFD